MDKYEIGENIKVLVTGIAKYGIFATLPNGAQGLIHISEISDGFVKDCSRFATVGSYIDVTVVGYGEKDNYKLSIKTKNRRPRQELKRNIRPPTRKEANKAKLETVSFTSLSKILESQINNAYDMLAEEKKHG